MIRRFPYVVSASFGVLCLLLVTAAAGGPSSPSETCSSPNCPITINDTTSVPATQDRAASPYPSLIALAHADPPGTIQKVTITINGLTAPALEDVDILLVRDSTYEVVELMSDAGGALPVSNLSLTFDDSAPSSIPQNVPPTSGTYPPTNYPGSSSPCAPDNPASSGTGDPFPAPAPSKPRGGYSQLLDVFTDTKYGGTWRLYVGDDCGSGVLGGGSITSWSVNFTLLPFTQLHADKYADAATVSAGSPIGFGVNVFNCCDFQFVDAGISDPLPGGPGIDWTVDQPNTGCSIMGSPPSETLSCGWALGPFEGAGGHVSSPTSSASCGKYTNVAEAYGFEGSYDRAKAWTTVACPTAARVTSLAASRSARGVVVQWRTGSQLGTLGFNVYREAKGRRSRLNPALIPARAIHGRGYSWLDRRAPRHGKIRYWIQELSLDGGRSWHGPSAPAR